jgi:hypothetical protein
MSLCDKRQLQAVCTQILKFAKKIFSREEEIDSAVFCKFKKGYYAEVSKEIVKLNAEDFVF